MPQSQSTKGKGLVMKKGIDYKGTMMKKKRLISLGLFSLLMVTILLSFCKCSTNPSAIITTKSYWFTGLQGILVSDRVIVYYTDQEKTDSIKVLGPKNMVDNLEIKKTPYGILDISLNRGETFNCKSEDQYVKIWISQPNLRSFTVMKNAQIHSNSLFSMSKVCLEAFTSAIIHFDVLDAHFVNINAYSKGKVFCGELSARSLEISAFTQSEIVVSGKTGKANISSYSANVDSNGLIIETN